MDFDYSEDQQLLMSSYEGLLEKFRDPPHGLHGHVSYSAELQTELEQSGYLDLLDQEGFGLLECSMLIEATAHCPVSVELAASLMIGPLLGSASAPVAVAWGVGKPVRYLPQAKTVCVIENDGVSFGTPSGDILAPANSVAAYPLAILKAMPADAQRLAENEANVVRRRALIGLAAEASGLMRGALDNTVQYVKDREQFGHPIGDFQAIQHRLAEDAQIVRACRWLAFRAADSDDLKEASVACLYAQQAIRKLVTDCHQFSGAMGLTLEFPLHLWTYRLKVLQGEAGGKAAHGQRVAAHIWPDQVPA